MNQAILDYFAARGKHADSPLTVADLAGFVTEMKLEDERPAPGTQGGAAAMQEPTANHGADAWELGLSSDGRVERSGTVDYAAARAMLDMLESDASKSPLALVPN